MIRRFLQFAACSVILLSTATCTQQETTPDTNETAPAQARLDISAVSGLLDLLDSLVAHNPPVRETNARLSVASPSEQTRILDSLTQSNARDVQINRQIDALLALPAYRLYYTQFSNMTADKHRAIFWNMPHRVIGSPADISSNLMELLIHRPAVRTWIDDVVDSIDLDRSNKIALQWLPPGDYTMPNIHFIYDGNADAFAQTGEVCFDLYGIVFAKRPANTRFVDLASVDVGVIEGVLAHEIQHTYAEPLLYPPGRNFDTWQDQWVDRVTRRFVSEGIAMHCNPPAGFRKEVKEDTGVVHYWIGQLNAKFAALQSETMNEEDLRSWYRATYHDSARAVLERYCKRAYPDSDLRQVVAEHLIDRPSLDYTLGWWMITHILKHDGKETVLGLLSDPSPVFKLYNETLSPERADLKVTF